MKFGKRTVVGEAYKKGDDYVYDCTCECGEKSFVRVRALEKGRVASCRSCARPRRTDLDRFSEKWKAHSHRSLPGKGPCWEWIAGKSGHYGTFYFDGKDELAHRFSYYHYNGPIKGRDVHHLCEFKLCVNPKHVEAISHQEHMRLTGSTPGATRASSAAKRAKTHCAKGHEYNEENTHHDKKNNRSCRACGRERQRRFKAQ